MQLYSIPTGHFKLDGGAMFGVVPKSLWSKQYPADENNMIDMVMRCLLVVDGDRKILINNGIGDKQSEKFFSHYYLSGNESLVNSLAEHGFKPEDITDMFLTHLHFDHCGGSVKRNTDNSGYELTFPNATYHISAPQWNWAMNANKRETASFLIENIKPIEESGHLKLFDNGDIVFKDIEVRLYNGHTEGQAIPFIPYKGKKVVFTSDTLPTKAHLPLPWIMSYDTRPLITLEEKEQFVNEAADNEYIIFLEHDAYNECFSIEKSEKGFKATESFMLKDI
ncbi:MAG TPA: MBL fold metallo-hydrolase [Lentimicrobium sp.]|nr:MBL fold metallo-hydrolase [Lentimicrobium sp.]